MKRTLKCTGILPIEQVSINCNEQDAFFVSSLTSTGVESLVNGRLLYRTTCDLRLLTLLVFLANPATPRQSRPLGTHRKRTSPSQGPCRLLLQSPTTMCCATEPFSRASPALPASPPRSCMWGHADSTRSSSRCISFRPTCSRSLAPTCTRWCPFACFSQAAEFPPPSRTSVCLSPATSGPLDSLLLPPVRACWTVRRCVNKSKASCSSLVRPPVHLSSARLGLSDRVKQSAADRLRSRGRFLVCRSPRRRARLRVAGRPSPTRLFAARLLHGLRLSLSRRRVPSTCTPLADAARDLRARVDACGSVLPMLNCSNRSGRSSRGSLVGVIACVNPWPMWIAVGFGRLGCFWLARVQQRRTCLISAQPLLASLHVRASRGARGAHVPSVTGHSTD